MKAMILAAGKGERMLPLTQNLPKPLLHVGDKTLIEHHLMALAAAGFSEVVINVAYLADKITDFLGGGEKYGLRIDYSCEPEPLETAGAIDYAEHLLGHEPFVLLNADTFCDFPLADLLEYRLPEATLAHLILVENPAHNPGGDYNLSATGRLLNKTFANETGPFTFSGLSVIHPQLIRQYPHKEIKYPLRDVFNYGIRENLVSAELYRGQWCDVGTPQRLAELNASLKT